MRAGIGTVRNAVAIDILVAAEVPARFKFLGGHDFAAVVVAAAVPGERRAQALVHADVEVGHDEDRRLQAVGEVEGLGRELEALVRIFGQQQDVFGVAVRGVAAGEDVRLLGAGRHAGRGAAALHIDDGDRDLGEIGEADELVHQRDAGAGGGGEGARAVPAGAGDDADRGDLVFGLDDRVAVLAGFGIDAVLLAVGLERLGQ